MMPPGFYSKTFKWPPKLWPTYENVIRQFAGFGSTPEVGDAEWYDHLHHYVDVLVVGGGLAGLQSALNVAENGLKVLLVDEQAQLGGWLLSDASSRFDGISGAEYAASLAEKLKQHQNVTVFTRTTAFALPALHRFQRARWGEGGPSSSKTCSTGFASRPSPSPHRVLPDDPASGKSLK